MKERGGVEKTFARARAEVADHNASVIRQPPMVQGRALGRPRGSRGVLDLNGIRGLHVGQFLLRRPRGAKTFPIRQRNSGAQGRQLPGDLFDPLPHRAAAIFGQVEDARGPGLPERIGEFRFAIGGVERDQDQAREAHAELQKNPLGEVRRPDGDVLTGLEAPEQRLRHDLGLVEQFAETKTPAGCGVGFARDQGHAVGIESRGLAEHASHRRLEHRFGEIRREMGAGQHHENLLGPIRTTSCPGDCPIGPHQVNSCRVSVQLLISDFPGRGGGLSDPTGRAALGGMPSEQIRSPGDPAE